MPYPLYIALRYLRFHRGSTFLSVITMISIVGVAVGTAALVIALALNAGFVQDVRERIHSGSAHLTVMSGADVLFEGGEEVAARVAQVEGVRAAGAVLHSPAMALSEEFGESAYAEMHGVDPEAHARVTGGDGSSSSPFLRLDQPSTSGLPGVVVGEDLALDLGVTVGDRLRVLVPQVTLAPWGAQPRSRVFEVMGTYASGHFQQDAVRVWVRRDEAGRLLRAEGRSSWIEIRLDDLRRVATMKESLRRSLGGPWLVIDLIEQNEDLLKALNTEKMLLFLAIGLIVVVASMNIVSTLILMVTDKVKEIGTLTAMGARANGIAAVFVLQGSVIGVVGTIAGLVLGSTVAFTLDRARLLRLDPDVYYLDHVPFTLQPLDVAAVGVAALAVSLVATIYPALKAARLDPVEAMRHD